MSIPVIADSPEWNLVTLQSVGGLTEVGLSADEKRVKAIGPAAQEWFPTVGLWGGRLGQTNSEGWKTHVESRHGQELLFIQNNDSGQQWLVDTPLTDTRAFGFSSTGQLLILATTSDITAYRKTT